MRTMEVFLVFWSPSQGDILLRYNNGLETYKKAIRGSYMKILIKNMNSNDGFHVLKPRYGFGR